MKLTIQRINELESARRSNSGAVVADVHMTEEQMYDALMVFLEHIDDETWDKWVREINQC